MELLPHADIMEVSQVAASLAASLILAWALYDALRDALRSAQASKDPSRAAIALGNVVRSAARLLNSGIFTLAGFALLLLPPPPAFDLPADYSLGRTVLRAALIAATLVILADAFFERYTRRRFLHAMRALYVERRADAALPVPAAPVAPAVAAPVAAPAAPVPLSTKTTTTTVVSEVINEGGQPT